MVIPVGGLFSKSAQIDRQPWLPYTVVSDDDPRRHGLWVKTHFPEISRWACVTCVTHRRSSPELLLRRRVHEGGVRDDQEGLQQDFFFLDKIFKNVLQTNNRVW